MVFYSIYYHKRNQQNRKNYIYMLLIMCCLINISCIKQVNLYQGDNDEKEGGANTSSNQEVICEPDFFYPFSEETKHIQAEITIHTKTKLSNAQTITAEIPPLKYNKSWLCMLTQDDCQHAAFSCTWAAIHGKPLSKEYFYDLTHLQTGDLPPDTYGLGKTLGSTDGAGNEVRFSFTTTLAPEWEFMDAKTSVNKGFDGNYFRFFMKSGLVWGNVKEMLNYGVGISFHDVNTEDVHNEQVILEYYEIAQKIMLNKLSGRGCKMLAEPNGNKTYTNAALAYQPIQTMTAEKGGTILYPYQREQDLKKTIIQRSFFNPSNIDKRENIEILKDAIIKELLKTKEERSAICIGVHRTDSSWVDFLLWLNNEYGKNGLDNIWMPNQEEYYEYNYYRTRGEISSPIQLDDSSIKLRVSLPCEEYFYFPSVTVNLSGIQWKDIASIETNDDVTGLSYASYNDGVMLNIDCRKYLPEHAENFVKRYEANPSDASNKADALYFVNMLKESDKKEALKRRLQ